ncbi:MAG: ABC transporter ATP-binding protein [Kiritimatiellae bacterium]|nr:ABC transporter ATP-binding protein [Kiritimatiellia bacterium]
MRKHLDNLAGTIARAVRLVWRSHRRLALIHLLLTPLLAVLAPLSLFILKRVVDVTEQIWTAGTRTQLAAWRPLFGLLAVAAGVMLAGMLLRAALTWFGQALQFRVDDQVRRGLHERLLAFDLEFFENPERLDKLYLARDQALQRPIHMVTGLLQLVRSAAAAAGILALLVSFRWWLPPLLLVGALPGMALRLRRARKLYAWRQELMPVERETAYFDRVLSGGAHAKELRVYGHGAYFRERYQELRTRLRSTQLDWRLYVLGGDLIAQVVALSVVAAALALLGRDVLAGAATLGGITMCVQGINRGHGALSGIMNGLVGLYEDALFLQGYEELMRHPVSIRAPAQPKPAPRRVRAGVVFEHVSFTYPAAKAPTLRDVSFALRPGECVALAGGNGSGKSTVVKLLCRFYDPTEGAIRVDGVDLRDFDPWEWRQRLGVLFQDFGVYPLTARENIWFGDIARDRHAPDLAEATRRAGASQLVGALPRGYDTRLGRVFADSVELSVGQWQRLALARAFARDSALFVLDEPTSALDAAAQRDLLAQLADWKRDRIVLLVSHGPAAMQSADRTITLARGQLVGEG